MEPKPKPVDPKPAIAQTTPQPKPVDPKANASPRSIKFSLDDLPIRGKEPGTKTGGQNG